jgi:S1-C subfamily serine protease
MSFLRAVQPYLALFAAAVLGGATAVGAIALTGSLDGGTTIVTQTVPSSTTETTPSPAKGMTVGQIYDHAAPGVVQITSLSDDASLGGSALGSGFVVDTSGHIVTNYHVVQGADEIRVSFSNRDTVQAELVGVDPSTDLALLKVDASASALTPLPLGNSDKVDVGDPVVAIGNPFGLDRTATAGIVSAVQRQIQAPDERFAIDHVIQTDAPINKGNSGGPLLNTRGQVIGVNTQIETGGVAAGNVGIGFSVPSNTVKDVVAQLRQTGHVEHPYLGIRTNVIDPELADSYNLPVRVGVIVEEVYDGSGADRAGLRGGDTEVVFAGETYVLGGDVIVAVDDTSVVTPEELRDAISGKKPGDKIDLTVYRDGKRTSVTVTLGRRPATPQG